MTKEEALELLATAPADDKPSRVNRSLTRAQGVGIVTRAIKSYDNGQEIPSLMEKRVWQVVKNQKRPRY